MSEYPKLFWRPDGSEVRADTSQDGARLLAEGCTEYPSWHLLATPAAAPEPVGEALEPFDAADEPADDEPSDDEPSEKPKSKRKPKGG